MKWLKELLAEVENGSKIESEIKKQLAKEFVPKQVFNDSITEVKELKTQVTDRDKQLEDLKKEVEGNQELVDKIEKLEQENQSTKEDYEEKIANMTKKQIAAKMLMENKAKDIDVNMALFNLDDYALSDKGDSLEGFAEAIAKHREEYSYLYKSDKQSYGGFKPIDGLDNPEGEGETSLGTQFAKKRNEQSQVESKLWD